MANTIDLAELGDTRAKLVSRRDQLTTELEDVSSQIKRLDDVFEAVAALLGDEGVAPAAPASPPAVTVTVPQPKRFKSPAAVATVVEQFPRGATRGQIRDAFFEAHQDLGWEAPDNAFNNALGRAVQRGLIVRVNDLYFPLSTIESQSGWSEAGEHDA